MSAPRLRIALACGGTGGHIFPGLATAQELRARGHDVTLWLAGKDVESTAVRGWDGPVTTVPSRGFSGGLSWGTVATVWRLWRAARICRRRMRRDRPDILLAMGSYASVGPARAAFKLSIPVVLHEANVIPGRAIAVLARQAQAVAAVFEETQYHLRRHEVHITGMPLRREVLAGRERAAVRAPGPFTVLVMGGSRGAHRLNELALDALADRSRPLPSRLRVIHLTGPADEAAVRARYAAAGVDAEVHGFFADMAALYGRADLAVCRSGAATCAELLAYGLPALLVPYPYAARNHQLANARAMARMGAADVVEERDLESDWLADYLCGMARATERRERLRKAALSKAKVDAARQLAALVERVAAEERRAREAMT